SPCAFAPRYDLSRVADRIEAWLPEPIAVMKLRAFVSAIGGEVVGSEPGLFRVRIRDPRLSAGTKRRFAWFGWTRDKLSADDGFLHLDLHMERSNRKPGGVVEIVVVLEAKSGETAADAEMRFGFGQRICRELRAYLISGR
ncbi:MAG: hypothetical protein NZO58_10640, partial [Gemmataceae bacterium]|nr:hypothetical protein [Gemmataceae bacterium]